MIFNNILILLCCMYR